MPHLQSHLSSLKQKLLHIFSDLALFWRVFLLMLCFTFLLLMALNISHRTAEESLRENYLKQAQTQLEQNTQTMTTALYNTYAIPAAIESSKYFNYIRTETSGVLPQKYISVLASLRSVLSNQLFLQRASEECILYFSGPNSIVTKNKVFAKAEDCFESYIAFSEMEDEDILSLLREKNTLTMLPLQEIQIGAKNSPEARIAFVVRPRSSSISVLTIYDLQTILGYFGMDGLPEGTTLSIDSLSGQNILCYPAQPERERDGAVGTNTISTRSASLRCTVTITLPDDYFTQQLSASRHINLILTMLFFFLSIVVTVLLARLSVKPVTRLAETVSSVSSVSRNKNEVQFLSAVLSYSAEERDSLQSSLLSSILSRALSGVHLLPEEEAQLREQLGPLCDDYRVAILYSDNDSEQMSMIDQLKAALPEGSVCLAISLNQTGMMFPSQESALHALEKLLSEQTEAANLLCGVSAKNDQLSQMYIAVKQARLAVPQQGILGVFSGGSNLYSNFSWLQHERLYQCLLGGDEENSLFLLRSIADSASQVYAREYFYNVLFVLRSAAENQKLSLQTLMVEYDLMLTPRENFGKLGRMALLLFEEMRKQQDLCQIDENRRVLDYLSKSFSDPDCCAADAAQALDMTEKRVYTLVRKATDMSFGDYLLSLRMRRAAELLCTTTLSAAEIAQQCGYLAVNTFYRAFRKYYDTTPTQFRKTGSMERGV